jgi:hypothetical protein
MSPEYMTNSYTSEASCQASLARTMSELAELRICVPTSTLFCSLRVCDQMFLRKYL